MPLMPFSILGIWLRGLLSIAILAGGIALLRQWYVDSHVVEVAPATDQTPADDRVPARDGEGERTGHRVFHFDPGWNRQTGELAAGLALLTWSLAGGLIARGLTLLTLPKGNGDDPRSDRNGEARRIRRPDGSELHVEVYGPADGPTIVLTHGWGANSTEWYYLKKHLADRFRLVVWDLPGLGLSKKPDDNDYRLETMAADLNAVLTEAGERPAVLLGHSIGGMITLTFCRLFPESLGSRVAGLVLVDTSYTNPVRTTSQAALYTALEKPVLVPLLHLTIALWPLVWLMNWMSYLNGSAHQSTHSSSFAGTETRGQLDFATRFMPHARPDILARGMFGMLAYDATGVLKTIPVPTLVFVGDRDTTTTPEAARFIAQGIPRAELVTLTPGKHMSLIERYPDFDRHVAEFAGGCLQAGPIGKPTV